MTIGGISNMNYAAAMRLNTPSAAMRLGPPAAEQALRYLMHPQTPVDSPVTPSLIPINTNTGNPGLTYFSPDGDIVEISRRGMLEPQGAIKPLEPQEACQTCENRRYVDQSDDASVSFQTPTKVSSSMAGMAVAAHEQEHVRNEQANALRDDREIVNQSVTLHYDTCSECGKVYVSGGTTRTTSMSKSESENTFGNEAANEEDVA